MRFHVISVFPEMIEGALQYGVVGQALKENRLSLSTLSPREFTVNVHQSVDDRPFGGGDGMVMMAEPLSQAVESIRKKMSARKPEPDGSKSFRVIHLSPRGKPLTDQKVRELCQYQDLVLVASRYGGVDQRFLNSYVDEEISIGDYVLSGGELAALVLIDAVARHLPGVLGNQTSPEAESFACGLLEEPQYTRPREWNGELVPQMLLSGDHPKIEVWKRYLAILTTAFRRPDLLRTQSQLTRKEVEGALELLKSASAQDLKSWGLFKKPKSGGSVTHRDAHEGDDVSAQSEAISELMKLLKKTPSHPAKTRRKN